MGLFSKKAKKEPARAEPAETEPSGPAPSSAEGIQQELRECVARLSEGKLGLEAIDPRSHMFDNGYIDSLRSAELVAFIERRYSVRVSEMQLVGKLCTLEALSRHVAAEKSRHG